MNSREGRISSHLFSHKTATRNSSFSKNKPQLADGVACNQSPEWGAETARIRARPKSEQQTDIRCCLITPTIWASHDRCRVAAGPSTGAADVSSDQRAKQQSNVTSGNWKKNGRISCWRGLVLTAEARNADGANETTDLTPNPPSRTGNEDCNHWSSDNCTFNTSPRPARTITSKRAKRSLSTQ